MENEIKSIWDGWVKQFRCPDGKEPIGCGDNATCAITYLPSAYGGNWKGIEWVSASWDRVSSYILLHYPEAANYWAFPPIYANNELGWTPEKFREVDRLTQIEAVVKPLVESVPVIEQQEAVFIQS